MNGKKHFYEQANKKEKNLKGEIENEGGLTRKDTFAMTVSAFLVIFPITIAILVGMSLLLLWLFGAL